VNDSTKVSRDGVKTSLSDVRPGDEVRAAYLTGSHEGPIAQVDVRSSKKGSSEGTGSSEGAGQDTDKEGSSSK